MRVTFDRSAPLVFTILIATGCSSPAPTTPSAPTVTGLTISGLLGSLAIGQSVQLIAHVTLSDGTGKQALDAMWQSSDKTVATVSPTGLLSSVALGAVDVTASASGISAKGHVLVVPHPDPTASLVIRIGQPSFPVYMSPVRWALMGLTPITFDASGSTGDALAYSIEIGDGNVSDKPLTVQPAMARGNLTARLTVRDRQGRVDSSTASFVVASLVTYLGGYYNEGRDEGRRLHFTAQDGRGLAGSYYGPEGSNSHFAGSISGDHNIHLLLDDGTIEFTGTVSEDTSPLNCGPLPQLTFTIRGGSADGQTLRFHYYFDGC